MTIPESTLQRLETAPTMMHCSVVEMRELVRVYRASIAEGSRAGWVCPETYMLTLEAVQTEAKRVAELSAEVERLRAELAAALEDAGKWRRANGTYFSNGEELRCHVNVGLNVWRGEEWLAFYQCSPEELDALIAATTPSDSEKE